MAIVYRKKLEEAFWKLMDMADEWGIAVSFIDARVDIRMDDGLQGCFECTTNTVWINKRVEDKLTIRHIFTLAHELRHVYQYRTRMYPSYWLCMLCVYTGENPVHVAAVEADADQWAKEFMIKNKLPVPIEEKISKEDDLEQP